MELPEISNALRTGHPSRMDKDEEDFDQDAYDAYCDRCYEEARERRLFGDD